MVTIKTSFETFWYCGKRRSSILPRQGVVGVVDGFKSLPRPSPGRLRAAHLDNIGGLVPSFCKDSRMPLFNLAYFYFA